MIVLNKFCIIIFYISLLCGLWNNMFPMVLLTLLGIIVILISHSHKLSNNLFIVLSILIITEIIVLICSIYIPNSLAFLSRLSYVFLCLIIFQYFIARSDLSKNNFILVMSLISTPILIVTVWNFLITYIQSRDYGFNDFSQLRFLYTPLLHSSNEWVSVLLALFPFSILPLFSESGLIRNERVKGLYRLILWINISLFTITLFISFSRAAYLSFAVCVFLFNLLCLSRGIKVRHKLFYFDIVIVVTVFLMSIFFYRPFHTTLFSSHSVSHQLSNSGRIETVQSSMNVIKENKLVGVGSGNFSFNYENNQREDFTGRINNTALEILIEKGIIGLMGYFAAFSLLFLQVFKNFRSKKPDEKISAIICWCFGGGLLLRDMFFSSILMNNFLLTTFFILLILPDKKENRDYLPINKTIFGNIIRIGFISFFLCITTLYLQGRIKSINYNRSLESLFEKNYLLAEEYAKRSIGKLFISPLHYSQHGLVFGNQISFELSSFLNNKYKPLQSDEQYITLALENYESAIKINPTDGLFYCNAAWLHCISGNTIEAEYFIVKAIGNAPYRSEYHIMQGVIYEKSGQIEKSLECYKKAVKLSPEICFSDFYSDLSARRHAEIREIVVEVSRELKEEVELTDNPIFKARLALLYMVMSKIDYAKSLYLETLDEMPGLNRPWLYLGYIFMHEGKKTDAWNSWNKSYFIAPMDYLYDSMIAEYYDQEGKQIDAKYAQILSDSKKQRILSTHASKSLYIYKEKSYNNDFLPKDFLIYIKPDTNNLKKVFERKDED